MAPINLAEATRHLVTKTTMADTVFGFVIDGANYAVTVRSGIVAAAPGWASPPDVTITLSEETFHRLMSRKLDPAVAFALGKIRVQGPLATASKLGQLLA